MTDPIYVELSAGDTTVRLNGQGGFSTDYLIVNDEGIEGWYSTPDAKVEMTEMQTGDGSHAVAETDILYSARTITLGWTASATTGDSRPTALQGVHKLLALAHKLVTIRVIDSTSDTYAVGYLQVETDSGIAYKYMSGTVTIVCADPRRYSTQAHSVQAYPPGDTEGGLYYMQPDDWAPEPLYPSDTTWPSDTTYPSLLWSGSLVYPLYYVGTAVKLQNIVTVTNAGTSPCYPTITITGPMDGGFSIEWSGGRVVYSEDVEGVPLVLESLTRTASISSLDRSRYLTERVFPVIQPGESETITLRGTGTGWATVEWNDTYM